MVRRMRDVLPVLGHIEEESFRRTAHRQTFYFLGVVESEEEKFRG